MKPKETHRRQKDDILFHINRLDTVDIDENNLFLVCIDSDKEASSGAKKEKTNKCRLDHY